LGYLKERIEILKARGIAKLKEIGFTDNQIRAEVFYPIFTLIKI